MFRECVPQGLKPGLVLLLFGTTEVMPFQGNDFL